MPLYNFVCPDCGKKSRAILKPEQAKDERLCECGQTLKRDVQGPTTKVVERLDNGLMPRAVERLAETDRLIRERKPE